MRYLFVFLFLIASSSSESQIVFSYTGAVQTYTVPLGVFEIAVDMVGAGAGESAGLAVVNVPGAGGRVETSLTVTPGDVLSLYVGGEGLDGVAGIGSAGGWNGGGDAGGAFGLYAGGSGGGASDIRNGGVALTDRVVVAGGGGGPATNTFAGGDNGGDGGGLIADDGVSGDLLPTVFGYGGTQVAGGAFGFFAPYIDAIAGVLGDGGHAGTNSAGGGGGGGYYGGGGGCWGGGGGGSSFVDAAVTSGTTHTIGFNTGDGEITITPISILPIEINKFIATLNDNNNVELAWTTLSERDNDYFEIEKSINGYDNWKTVTIEKGAGNSSIRIDYIVLDENPNYGISYYRLKQIDFNGDSKVFDPVLIDFSTSGNSFIYPNPTANNINLTLDSKNVDLKDIRIFNQLGQDVTNKIRINSIENNQFALDLSNLSNGSYFIKTPFEAIKFSKIQ